MSLDIAMVVAHAATRLLFVLHRFNRNHSDEHRGVIGLFRGGISDYGMSAADQEEEEEEAADWRDEEAAAAAAVEGTAARVGSSRDMHTSADKYDNMHDYDGDDVARKKARRLAREKRGWAAAAASVEEALRAHAPVDGIVGFSEGAAVAVLIALKQQQEQQQEEAQEQEQRRRRRQHTDQNREPARGAEDPARDARASPEPPPPPPPPPSHPLSFVVSVAGFAMDVPSLARNLLGADMFQEPLLVPSLHVAGAADPLTLSRSDADSSLLRALMGDEIGGGGAAEGNCAHGGGLGDRSGSAVSTWLAWVSLTYAQPTTLVHRGGHGFPSVGAGRGNAVVTAFMERRRRDISE